MIFKCLVNCFSPSKSPLWVGNLFFPSQTYLHQIGDGRERENNCFVSQYSRILFTFFFYINGVFFQLKALQKGSQSCEELIEQLSCCHWLRKPCMGAGSGFQLAIQEKQPVPGGIKNIWDFVCLFCFSFLFLLLPEVMVQNRLPMKGTFVKDSQFSSHFPSVFQSTFWLLQAPIKY